MADPRYPIGKFSFDGTLNEKQKAQFLDDIEQTPAWMEEAVKGLSESQLDTPYRDGGWTVRQLVHHLPDSHMNAYVRFKLALTESVPTIKPYAEDKWAELADSRSTPIETSLVLLESLHSRWVLLLRSLKPEDFSRKLVHPDRGEKTIDWLLFVYGWHGPHHTAHITELRKAQG